MAILSSVAVVNAGWFDGMVECDSYKFKVPDGYSGSGNGSAVLLTGNEESILAVQEISKDNFTDFMNTDFTQDYGVQKVKMVSTLSTHFNI